MILWLEVKCDVNDIVMASSPGRFEETSIKG